MTDTSPTDEAATTALPREMQQMVAHHRELTTLLRKRVAALRSVIIGGQPFAGEHASVRDFLTVEVIPHARAEEDVVYDVSASLPDMAALVEGMTMEHEALVSLATQFADADNGALSISAATAFSALFDVHVRKENELLLPALASRGIEAPALLAGMKSAFDAYRRSALATTPGDDTSASAERVVDTRLAATESCAQLTNKTIDALAFGESFLLVADHDPVALRYMLDAERPGATSWQPLEDGPARWQVRVRNVGTSAR